MQIQSSKGMTLLELMLVLAISASLVLMGFGMYQRYRTEQDFNQLKYNVDTLMQAMRLFYHSNCGGEKGLLSPLRDDKILDQAYSLDINLALQNKKYLSASWPQTSILLDDTFGYEGYSAKFVPKTFKNQKVGSACYFENGDFKCGFKEIDKSVIVLWVLEVAVKINDVSLAQRYWAYVGATCTVEDYDVTTVVDCKTQNSDKGQILVWQTVPSDTITNINSDAWLSTPVVKQFNLLYTHDPMYELFDPQDRYYLCGG